MFGISGTQWYKGVGSAPFQPVVLPVPSRPLYHGTGSTADRIEEEFVRMSYLGVASLVEIEILGVELFLCLCRPLLMPVKLAVALKAHCRQKPAFVPSIQAFCGLDNVLAEPVSRRGDRELGTTEYSSSFGTHCWY